MMRHSDIRITMKLYADVTGLPLAEAAAALPSFGVKGSDLGGLESYPLKIGNG